MQILLHKCESKKENCFLLVLSLRIVEQRLQSLAQRGWESGRPRCINQTDLNHILQVRLILASVAVEFHLNERLQFDDTFVIDLYSSIHSGRRASVFGTHFAISDEDMESLARFSIGPVEKHDRFYDHIPDEAYLF